MMMSEKLDFPEFKLNYSEIFRELRRRSRECLSLEELDAYLAGKLSGRKLEHADKHLRSCSMCAAELKQLDAFLSLKDEQIVLDAEQWKRAKNALDLQFEELFKARRAKAQVPSLREKLAAWWSSFWLLFAQASYVRVAVLILVLGIGLVLYWPYLKQGDLLETTIERRIEEAGKIKILQPLGKVSQPPSIFQWQAIPEAKYYMIEVYTTDLETIWTSGEIFTNRVSLPQEIVGKLQTGKSYLWKVQAFDKNRKMIKDSTVQAFEIAVSNF
jgi:hypothetical protein